MPFVDEGSGGLKRWPTGICVRQVERSRVGPYGGTQPVEPGRQKERRACEQAAKADDESQAGERHGVGAATSSTRRSHAENRKGNPICGHRLHYGAAGMMTACSPPE